MNEALEAAREAGFLGVMVWRSPSETGEFLAACISRTKATPVGTPWLPFPTWEEAVKDLTRRILAGEV